MSAAAALRHQLFTESKVPFLRRPVPQPDFFKVAREDPDIFGSELRSGLLVIEGSDLFIGPNAIEELCETPLSGRETVVVGPFALQNANDGFAVHRVFADDQFGIEARRALAGIARLGNLRKRRV